jgi:hypothetical protein
MGPQCVQIWTAKSLPRKNFECGLVDISVKNNVPYCGGCCPCGWNKKMLGRRWWVHTNEEDLLFGIAVSPSFSDESIEVSKGGESIGASNKRID